MSARSDHPTAGRRRKYKSPATRAAEEAIARLDPPVLPDHLRGDDDVPTCSDNGLHPIRLAQQEAPIQTTMTGWIPNKRLSLVRELQLTWTISKKELLTTQLIQKKLGKELSTTQQYQLHVPQNRENYPASGTDSKGFGSASLAECLDRLGGLSNLAAPATCASGESNEGNLSQTDPRQVMSPSFSQTLPQDPFHVQEHSREDDSRVRPENSFTRCKKEETPTSVPKKKEFDVKEEPESPGSREGVAAQARTKRLEGIRPSC